MARRSSTSTGGKLKSGPSAKDALGVLPDQIAVQFGEARAQHVNVDIVSQCSVGLQLETSPSSHCLASSSRLSDRVADRLISEVQQ